MSSSEAGPSTLLHSDNSYPCSSSSSHSNTSATVGSDNGGRDGPPLKRMRMGGGGVVAGPAREKRRGGGGRAGGGEGAEVELRVSRPRRAKARGRQRQEQGSGSPSSPLSHHSASRPSNLPVAHSHPDLSVQSVGGSPSHPLTLHPSSSPSSPVVINLCTPSPVGNSSAGSTSHHPHPSNLQSADQYSPIPIPPLDVGTGTSSSAPLSHSPRADFHSSSPDLQFIGISSQAVPPSSMASNFINLALSTSSTSSSSSSYSPRSHGTARRTIALSPNPPRNFGGSSRGDGSHHSQRQQISILMSGGANASIQPYAPSTQHSTTYRSISPQGGTPSSSEHTNAHGYSLRTRPQGATSRATPPSLVQPSSISSNSVSPSYSPQATAPPPPSRTQPEPIHTSLASGGSPGISLAGHTISDPVSPHWGRHSAMSGGATNPLTHMQSDPIDLAARVDHSTAYISALRQDMRDLRSVPQAHNSRSMSSHSPPHSGPQPVPGTSALSHPRSNFLELGGSSRGSVPSVSRRRRDMPGGGPIRIGNTEVIVVDDSDDDEIVITGEVHRDPQRHHSPHHRHAHHHHPHHHFFHHQPSQLHNDERYARDLQAQLNGDHANREAANALFGNPLSYQSWSVSGGPGAGPSGTGVAGPSALIPPFMHHQHQPRSHSHPHPPNPHRQRLRDDPGDRSNLIRDNFDALASRVNSWSPAEARRFLHVASNGRRMRSRRDFVRAVSNVSPTIIFGAIMGSPFGGIGNSYEELLELAERLGPARPQGLDKTIIDALPVKEFISEEAGENTNCVVCMSDYEARDSLRTLPCTHEFHQKCIDPWLKDHKTCPICRVEVKMS